MCLIGANSENGRLGSDCVFDSLSDSENGRFGWFGRPAKPAAPTGGRFGRL